MAHSPGRELSGIAAASGRTLQPALQRGGSSASPFRTTTTMGTEMYMAADETTSSSDDDFKVTHRGRLMRHLKETRKAFTPFELSLMIIFAITAGTRWTLLEHSTKSAHMQRHLHAGSHPGQGLVPKLYMRTVTAWLSILTISNFLSLLVSIITSFVYLGKDAWRMICSWRRFWHFSVIGILFYVALLIYATAVQQSEVDTLVVMTSYLYMPIAAFISQHYFKRIYATMDWLALWMMTLAMCTFIALRTRYQVCNNHGSCGSAEAIRFMQEHINPWTALMVMLSVFISATASILAERLLHKWTNDGLYVLKVHSDMAALLVSLVMSSIHTIRIRAGTDAGGGQESGVAHQFLQLRWEDIPIILIIVADGWAAGAIVKYFNTVWKSIVMTMALIHFMALGDVISNSYEMQVSLGGSRYVPTICLYLVVVMSAILFHASRHQGHWLDRFAGHRQHWRLGQQDGSPQALTDALHVHPRNGLQRSGDDDSDDVSGSDNDHPCGCWGPDYHGQHAGDSGNGLVYSSARDALVRSDGAPTGDAAEDESGSENEVGRMKPCSPWFTAAQEADRHQHEQGDQVDKTGGFDAGCLFLSLFYILADASRTLLNQLALGDSQSNPNSISLMSFLLGVVYASVMVVYTHGFTKGKLWEAWSLRKIVEYGSASALQAVTMALVNMSFALGLTASMAAVLGKVYTPILAIGERFILRKRRLWTEWFAIIILTAGVLAFGYLSQYDYETGLDLSNVAPLLVCILGAAAAAIQALTSEKVFRENRDVDFYMHKVRFDVGSVFFTLLVVPFVSVTGTRITDVVWMQRPMSVGCDIDECWPSARNPGPPHWPWMNQTCVNPDQGGPCVGDCHCAAGLFMAWKREPALYAFLLIQIVYGVVVGKVVLTYGALHRAKCDAFSLVLLFWLGNPLLSYVQQGKPVYTNYSDQALNAVSLIVPLAAVASDFGKIASQRFAEEKASFRMGLVAAYWSQLLGTEVAVIISDAPRDENDNEFVNAKIGERIELYDQHGAAINKAGPYMKIVQTKKRMAKDDWSSLKKAIQSLMNCPPEDTEAKFEKLCNAVPLKDPSTKAQVAIGASTKGWAGDKKKFMEHDHMQLAVRNGASSATEKEVAFEIRGFGYAQVEGAVDGIATACKNVDRLVHTTEEESHRKLLEDLESLSKGMATPTFREPYIQYVMAEGA
eukprot:TRINITY_DN5371_c0_g1_i4.p1 TRINITY_DN5371_c0_g1~~TRINITY_DN5371_c0_g1_i4.p1  ORF type:complete len:1184 (+),score=261.34 TRINITY_DN5371_c0_g1_i4:133-3684(+)